MTFKEILAQVLEQLQREGRVSYRALKRQFALDDEYVEDLKVEIIDAKRLAVDEDGKVLVWVGASPVASSMSQVPRAASENQKPESRNQKTDRKPSHYSPPHLAERILAEQAAMESRGVLEGERKTITTLFADIKGSMGLIEDLDPEEARQLIDPVLHFMMD